MIILPQSQASEPRKDGGRLLITWVRAHLSQLVELSWFSLTLTLFLLMGPFSAIAVLFGLGSLASEKNREQMTEPARL